MKPCILGKGIWRGEVIPLDLIQSGPAGGGIKVRG